MKSQHFPGFLVAFEGIVGAGKTTQAHHLQSALQQRKLTVIRTKEPTAGKWGQILRDSALTGRLSLEQEVETFLNDRQEHVDKVILPHLRDGHVVILDRYYFSTAAYQGARGVDAQDLLVRNEVFAPEPDLLVLLDLDPQEGLKRISTRGDRANHFEQTETLQRAREIFLSLKKPYLFRVDALRPAAEISTEIVRKFSQLYTEAIAKTEMVPGEKLAATLKLFGGELPE